MYNYQCTDLWLGQHVQGPRAHLAIRAHTDQIVSILSPHHLHAVHGMLQRDISRQKHNKSMCFINALLDTT